MQPTDRVEVATGCVRDCQYRQTCPRHFSCKIVHVLFSTQQHCRYIYTCILVNMCYVEFLQKRMPLCYDYEFCSILIRLEIFIKSNLFIQKGLVIIATFNYVLAQIHNLIPPPPPPPKIRAWHMTYSQNSFAEVCRRVMASRLTFLFSV